MGTGSCALARLDHLLFGGQQRNQVLWKGIGLPIRHFVLYDQFHFFIEICLTERLHWFANRVFNPVEDEPVIYIQDMSC